MRCFCASFFFASCSGGSSDSDDDSSFPEHLLSYVGDQSYKSPNDVSGVDPENQSTDLKDGWWNDTAFYHIWVKSFCDSNGDGCGDFNGIKSKLDYIKNDLGCDGIWLSPIFECDYKTKSSSGNMHGYDVNDYYAVNSYFGTEDDLLSLIDACHEQGIKIIFDFVPNHTGKGNAWFTNSCEGGEKKTGMSGIIQNSTGIPEWARLTHGTKIQKEMIIIMQHFGKGSLI